MDRSGHIEMIEANELEITVCRELYGVGLRTHDSIERSHHPGIHARRTVEAGTIGCSSWTANWNSEYTEERRPYLPRCQKSHGMDLCTRECPTDAVVRMNP